MSINKKHKMKIAITAILFFWISICIGQIEIEKEYGLSKGVLTSENYNFINSFDKEPEGIEKLENVIRLLEFDSTENVIKVYLLEKYLSKKYMHNAKFVTWLIDNMEYEIDRNVYDIKVGLSKHKYPILYFLVNLEDSIYFNEVQLLNSDFLSNCELFEDSYTKMFTCKLLAEYFISSGKDKSELLEIASKEECRKNNYNQIMKFCY